MQEARLAAWSAPPTGRDFVWTVAAGNAVPLAREFQSTSHGDNKRSATRMQLTRNLRALPVMMGLSLGTCEKVTDLTARQRLVNLLPEKSHEGHGEHVYFIPDCDSRLNNITNSVQTNVFREK